MIITSIIVLIALQVAQQIRVLIRVGLDRVVVLTRVARVHRLAHRVVAPVVTQVTVMISTRECPRCLVSNTKTRKFVLLSVWSIPLKN